MLVYILLVAMIFGFWNFAWTIPIVMTCGWIGIGYNKSLSASRVVSLLATVALSWLAIAHGAGAEKYGLFYGVVVPAALGYVVNIRVSPLFLSVPHDAGCEQRRQDKS